MTIKRHISLWLAAALLFALLPLTGIALGNDPHDYAFVIAEGTVTIDEEQFAGYQFESVYIPESVLFIGPRAFADNASLKKIYIANPKITVNETFLEGCYIPRESFHAPEGSIVLEQYDLFLKHMNPEPTPTGIPEPQPSTPPPTNKPEPKPSTPPPTKAPTPTPTPTPPCPTAPDITEPTPTPIPTNVTPKPQPSTPAPTKRPAPQPSTPAPTAAPGPKPTEYCPEPPDITEPSQAPLPLDDNIHGYVSPKPTEYCQEAPDIYESPQAPLPIDVGPNSHTPTPAQTSAPVSDTFYNAGDGGADFAQSNETYINVGGEEDFGFGD